ncbi:hypothetical protein [Bosea sp. Root381]|uniref:hypothetical protein n=1 Tax=Bosea sp. Root381 TaxID=1736524 RepID=UPI0012E39D80|nr:hypothetical protein [Bosea sp. Root381]
MDRSSHLKLHERLQERAEAERLKGDDASTLRATIFSDVAEDVIGALEDTMQQKSAFYRATDPDFSASDIPPEPLIPSSTTGHRV